MSLLVRLLLLVVLSLLPPTLLVAWRAAEDRREQQASIPEQALQMAQLAAAEQRRIADGASQMLTALSLIPVVQGRDEIRCNLALRRLREQVPLYSAIGVAGPDGIVWCSSGRAGTDVSDRHGFRQAIETQRFAIGGYVVGRLRGSRTLNFNQPMYDEDGGLLGVLIVGLDLDHLAQDLARRPLPPGATLTVADPEGYVLVDLPSSTQVGQRLPERLRGIVTSGQPSVADVEWINGRRQIVGYVPAAASAGPPFLVTMGLDYQQAYGDAARRDVHAAIIAATVLAAALLAAWWFAARFIRRPLARLAAVADRWRQGDLTARSGRIGQGSEIGQLGQAFDAMAEAVAERERRLSDMLESTTDSVLAMDRDWRVTFLNARARWRLKDYELIGRVVWDVFPDLVGGTVWAAYQKSMRERVSMQVTFAFSRLGGHFETHIFPSSDGGVTVFAREVTEQVHAQEELRHLAYHDLLTGLPNRAGFNEAVARAGAAGALALLLLDLDDFKHVNEAFGHSAGDEVLRQVATRLSGCLAGRGMLARLGGDEFALLLSEERDVAEAEAIVTEMLAALEAAPFTFGGRLFRMAASGGLVLAPAGEGATPETLLADADLALYRAKADGGGLFRIFSPADREVYEARRHLDEELEQAVTRQEFELHYQPQVRLADGALVGAEALLRWRHPTRGLLTPGFFLEALESSRHARGIGNWIVDEACRQAAEWRRAGLCLRMGANLFGEQLQGGDLPEVVMAALARWQLPPEALELELTENIALRRDEGMLAALHALRAQGIGIAFDDFGTGFASLVTLQNVPVTRLKIDRSFITRLAEGSHDAAIVEAILTLARNLGLDVIAEGVETEAQEAFLRSRGCPEGQGYRYGKALPPAELLAASQCLPGRGDAPAYPLTPRRRAGT
ncbi:bifunctional diguanylate cyclase/phosphodiesterase [Pseudoroseomonas ludipueritiae]|uniref:EAL domain-containing protein n=1 Tax=Pseudoroseomonas ludipueritiae TaxID=198093 RepID=A0ABR7R669_9PROT|nr:EAL domain-containing protein [Pseudoroseomonas ludipueritiae]MCG7363709.1 EAL domain-containing protein [Roseomonas sp. ACRSG]